MGKVKTLERFKAPVDEGKVKCFLGVLTLLSKNMLNLANNAYPFLQFPAQEIGVYWDEGYLHTYSQDQEQGEDN